MVFFFALVLLESNLNAQWLKRLSLKLRELYVLTQSLLLPVSPCSHRCCFLVLCHAKQSTPCAVTMGMEHRRDSCPEQGKQVSLSLENTDFHHSTSARTENAELAVSRWDRSQGVHECPSLAVTWHSDATNAAPATRWQVGLEDGAKQ